MSVFFVIFAWFYKKNTFKNVMTYTYNDVSIQPNVISTIKHRSECNPLKNNMLPIFTAPMSTVINSKNCNIFEDNKIIPIIPRNIDYVERLQFMRKGKWIAVSLTEFKTIIKSFSSFDCPAHILIDVANGNMKEIFDWSKEAKEKYGKDNIILMSGNIANPKTYIQYCMSGIDYVRCGIGGGEGCITSSNVSLHYGIVNLLDEISALKKDVHKAISLSSEFFGENRCEYKCQTKVIADGGIRNYSDIIKALALGADYVMIGGLFARLIESSALLYGFHRDGSIYYLDPLKDDTTVKEEDGEFSITIKGDDLGKHFTTNSLYKTFYGMASKNGQIDLFGEKKNTSEGIKKTLECTTNVNKWSDNMKSYLCSAMSYCGLDKVDEFNPNNVDVYLMSDSLQKSINK